MGPGGWDWDLKILGDIEGGEGGGGKGGRRKVRNFLMDESIGPSRPLPKDQGHYGNLVYCLTSL